MTCLETNRGKQQSKRNSERNDNRSANIPEKNKENDDDQNHAFCQVVENGMRGVVNQIVAIQVWNDLYAFGKYLLIQLAHHGVKRFQHRSRVGSLAQKDDALDNIVVIENHAVFAMNRLPDLAQTNLWPLRDLSDVLDSQRGPVLGLEYRLLDVADALYQA